MIIEYPQGVYEALVRVIKTVRPGVLIGVDNQQPMLELAYTLTSFGPG